jgi:hypothetical protein
MREDIIMPRTYLRYTWVDPRVVSGPSSIHGEGVFAKEKIAAGDKIMEFGGEVISREEAFSGKYRSRSIWPIEGDIFLGLPMSDTHESLDEHLNHSCDANAWLTDEVTIAARRDIQPGEEITLDQGTWNFDDDSYTDDREPCSCGSTLCRRVLTKDDWKLSDLQERYRGHFHPLIQKMIDHES